MSRWLWLGWVLCLAGLAGGAGAVEKVSPKINVFVSIEPQANWVERIGGDRVAVNVMVISGREPHDYTPTPKQMAALSEADVYFAVGVPFEQVWVKKVQETNPRMKIVDTRQGIKLLPMGRIEELTDEHTAGGHEHEHGNLDPHIWLSPRLAKLQAHTMLVTLSEMAPEHKAIFEKNFAAFVAELNAVDDNILFGLQKAPNRTFMVFHPAFGYFADAYQLTQVAVEVEGKEPSAKQLARITEIAKRDGVKVIFVQPQFSGKSAEAIAAAVGAKVVRIDPMTRDYIANLKDIAAKVLEAMQ